MPFDVLPCGPLIVVVRYYGELLFVILVQGFFKAVARRLLTDNDLEF